MSYAITILLGMGDTNLQMEMTSKIKPNYYYKALIITGIVARNNKMYENVKMKKRDCFLGFFNRKGSVVDLITKWVN